MLFLKWLLAFLLLLTTKLCKELYEVAYLDESRRFSDSEYDFEEQEFQHDFQLSQGTRQLKLKSIVKLMVESSDYPAGFMMAMGFNNHLNFCVFANGGGFTQEIIDKAKQRAYYFIGSQVIRNYWETSDSYATWDYGRLLENNNFVFKFHCDLGIKADSVTQKTVRLTSFFFNETNFSDGFVGFWFESLKVKAMRFGCMFSDDEYHQLTSDLSEDSMTNEKCLSNCSDGHTPFSFFFSDKHLEFKMCINDQETECTGFPSLNRILSDQVNRKIKQISEESLLLKFKSANSEWGRLLFRGSFSDFECIYPPFEALKADVFSTESFSSVFGRINNGDPYREYFVSNSYEELGRSCHYFQPEGKWKLYKDTDQNSYFCVYNCPENTFRYFFSDSWTDPSAGAVFCGDCNNLPDAFNTINNVYFKQDETCIALPSCAEERDVFSTGESACLDDTSLVWYSLEYQGSPVDGECSFETQMTNSGQICFEKCADFGLFNRNALYDFDKKCSDSCPGSLEPFRDENNEVYCLNHCAEINKVLVDDHRCDSEQGCNDIYTENGENYCEVLWS